MTLASSADTFCNLEKYTLQLREIHFANWTNTELCCHSFLPETAVNDPGLQCWPAPEKEQPLAAVCSQIHFAIWRNILCNLEKYILPMGQIHCEILTKSFEFGQMAFTAHCLVEKEQTLTADCYITSSTILTSPLI